VLGFLVGEALRDLRRAGRVAVALRRRTLTLEGGRIVKDEG